MNDFGTLNMQVKHTINLELTTLELQTQKAKDHFEHYTEGCEHTSF